ncbi:HET domain-containing protein [Microdochium nivale]|nr:HET domain-containing protein [Microdochium nivale]
MPLAYRELDPTRAQVRLLSLHPTSNTSFQNDNDTAPCLSYSLSPVFLDDRPRFVALSYVWGDPGDTVPILVDGTTVQITRNLSDVLHWHRGWRSTSSVWADAVCINQADPDEKGHQIKMMARVYKEASKVICWLGGSTPHMELWLHWSTRLGTRFLNKDSLKERVSGSLSRRAWWKVFATRYAHKEEAELFTALKTLQMCNGGSEFRRIAYSSRIWTFQESLLPKKKRLVCVLGGVIRNPQILHKSIFFSPPDFALAIGAEILARESASLSNLEKQIQLEFFQSLRYITSDADLNIWVTMDALYSKMELLEHSLGIALMATSNRFCSDPRDKVFALLGVLGKTKDEEETAARDQYLEPDPRKPVHQVVRDALYYVYCYESADVLPFILKPYFASSGAPGEHNNTCLMGHFNGQDRPSWLPDCERRRHRPTHLNLSTRDLLQRTDECNIVQWTTEPCGSHMHDYLAFNGRRLGQIVAAFTFPDEAVLAERALLEILMEGYAADANTTARYRTSRGSRYAGIMSEMDSMNDTLTARLAQAFKCEWEARYTSPSRYDDIQSSPRLSTAIGFPTAAITGADSRYLSNDLKWMDERGPASLCGLTLAVLDTGRFCVCEMDVLVGDFLVTARSWDGYLLLRSAAGQALTTETDNNDSEARSDSNARQVDSHACQFVDWPYVDGMDEDLEYFDRDYVLGIAHMPLDEFDLW